MLQFKKNLIQNLSLKAALVGFAFLMMPQTANATAAVDFPAVDGGGLFGTTPFTLGWEFTANRDIEVTSLGQFDFDQAGLPNSAEIAIFELDGTIVTTTTVGAGVAGELDGFFRYNAVASAILSGGTSYVIASYIADDTALDLLSVPQVFTVDPAITALNDRFESANSLVFPTQINSPGFFEGWFGPNFRFEETDLSSVPEAGTLALFGIGLVGLSLVRRSRKAT